MYQSNEEKLLEAGYTLLRFRDVHGVTNSSVRYDIWQWNKSMRHWSILEKEFPSKAAREIRMKQLLEDKKNLKW